MGKLRDRANEIHARAAEERKNFDPTRFPSMLASYRKWQDRTGDFRRSENFCHFFWASVLFGPSYRFYDGFLSKWYGIVTCLALFVAGIAWLSWYTDEPLVFFLLVGIPYVIAGALAGAVLTDPDEPRVASLMWTAFITLPVSVLTYLIVTGCERFPRAWRAPLLKGVVAVAAIAAAGLIGWLLFDLVTDVGWLRILIGVGMILAAMLVLGALIFGLSMLIEWISTKRAEKREAEEDEYVNGTWQPKLAKRREPGKVHAFFSGVGDFLLLIGQFVMTKKWKLCPLVTIPDEDEKQAA